MLSVATRRSIAIGSSMQQHYLIGVHITGNEQFSPYQVDGPCVLKSTPLALIPRWAAL